MLITRPIKFYGSISLYCSALMLVTNTALGPELRCQALSRVICASCRRVLEPMFQAHSTSVFFPLGDTDTCTQGMEAENGRGGTADRGKKLYSSGIALGTCLTSVRFSERNRSSRMNNFEGCMESSFLHSSTESPLHRCGQPVEP